MKTNYIVNSIHICLDFLISFLMIFYSFSMIDGHHSGCWSFGYILHHSHPHYNYENYCIYEIQRKIKSCFCFYRFSSVVKLTKWPTTLLICPSISLPVKCHCFKMYKKIDKGYTSMEAWLILVCPTQNPDRSSKFIFFSLIVDLQLQTKVVHVPFDDLLTGSEYNKWCVNYIHISCTSPARHFLSCC